MTNTQGMTNETATMTINSYRREVKDQLASIVGPDLMKLAYCPTLARVACGYNQGGAPNRRTAARVVAAMVQRLEFLAAGRDASGAVYTLRGHIARR